MTKQITVGIGLLFAFGVGCGAGVGASSLVVPPASAQQANLPRWEYFCDGFGGKGRANEAANQAGSQGWEMVSASAGGGGILVCFKRPLP
jgi:hypothetical protein